MVTVKTRVEDVELFHSFMEIQKTVNTEILLDDQWIWCNKQMFDTRKCVSYTLHDLEIKDG